MLHTKSKGHQPFGSGKGFYGFSPSLLGHVTRICKMHLSPQWLRLLSGLRQGSVVVDSSLIVAPSPIVGFCVCSMFCCAMLCVLSSLVLQTS